MAEETTDQAYIRGVTAGEIAARLAGHDKHLGAINGSLADLVVRFDGLRADVQRAADRTEESARTVAASAKAVRAAGERAWLPWSRIISLVAAAASLVAIIVALR